MGRGKGLKAVVRRYDALREKSEHVGLSPREIDTMDILTDKIDRLSMPKGWQEKSDAEHKQRIDILDNIKRRLDGLFGSDGSPSA
jgi:hypothetical protein